MWIKLHHIFGHMNSIPFSFNLFLRLFPFFTVFDIIGHCEVKHIMKLPIKYNDVSFECLDIHITGITTCHRTHCYASDKVCLDLKNC